ncbi:MAG: SpvB/TcaC N-terminal domain-containing protein, partial [Desulfobacteraceae bacterium]|nr:SpvB/TcaC N-terminal domain-containing protein [Desulfobacteraceae bacterium]
RKTDKGLPRYLDGQGRMPDSDVFLLSGAEDLVPEFEKDAAGHWVLQGGQPRVYDGSRSVNGHEYRIRNYRPRIEGLFARIERWTRADDPREVHWRSISRDNVLTIYGLDENSRITDPGDSRKIFSWLICETRDDKGNGVIYTYKPEDGAGLDLSQAHERNRGPADAPGRRANRYLKQIQYGNRLSLLGNDAQRPPFLSPEVRAGAGWMFEVVFDYGEHDLETPQSQEDPALGWTVRPDPFSACRAGFEVRTCRLCQRVLMFHHIPDLPTGQSGYDGLVRSTDFTYLYEHEPHAARNPIYSFLLQAVQKGYQQTSTGTYLSRSLPPLEFEYSQPQVQQTMMEVEAASLENLPAGLDGATYQWLDLHGEGLAGIFTEQAGAWYYKRNLSPLGSQGARFSPLERVAAKPNLSLAATAAQFMDLAGDGQPDLVVLNGPMAGLYEHDEEEGWQPFRAFTSRLNRDLSDPNLRLVDLDGDGHADVLITEEDALVWHASLAEEGFGPANRVVQALDEEKGPRLLLADGTQSIYLADLSGDGLTDLVRIRNGEVCYWPNLGYGRFGAKVTMDHSPWFEAPDLFDQRRIRLADIDGSGTMDIIYLHAEGPRLYFNQSGNGWSAPLSLAAFPAVDDLSSIQVVDLLGNGTACLAWSSPLPASGRSPMRYLALMEDKPHLLTKVKNNLGAETRVQYAPSTKYYLRDKQSGRPWVTRLPFPVHVVEKITIRDKWRATSFSSSFSYHHGYFDGIEREFRGFGRVEQIDVEDYGAFAQGNSASPYITDDHKLFQPPVKTVTWFHTGAFADQERILSQFQHEYFSPPGFTEHRLPEPDLEGAELTAQEQREALRACKGMMLRQEVFELDIDALTAGREVPAKLFSTAFHNCDIRRLQPLASNRHAIFQVTESEAITYHYELDLRSAEVNPDPRIAHTLNLRIDDYGHVLQSVAAVYARTNSYSDAALKPEEVALINDVQGKGHLTYAEYRFTDDEVDSEDHHRLPMPCQTRSYELSGIQPDDCYYSLAQLRGYALSDFYVGADPQLVTAVTQISSHHIPDDTVATARKRLMEETRTLYFHENLNAPLSFGRLNRLGLVYETYQLALTDGLLADIFQNKLSLEVSSRLSDPALSGYLSGAALLAALGPETAGQYWLRSGIAGFGPDAQRHFYLPAHYSDPFGHDTVVQFDFYELFAQSITDPAGNTVRIEQFDFRTMGPRRIKDMNANLSEVCFDVLGMPAAMAVKGKADEGDRLEGFDESMANPGPDALIQLFTQEYQEEEARRFLGPATARYLYYFGETRAADDVIHWNSHPSSACSILREKHQSQLPDGQKSPLQTSFEYSDGLAALIAKKAQAEPAQGGTAWRWATSGKTIFNNKGKPVKQYEPYFSATHCFEEPVEAGVTPHMYYDALGRLIRAEAPDGTFSRVDFSPWQATSWDANDTVLQSAWYQERGAPDPAMALPSDASAETRSAWLTARHAGTTEQIVFDTLGREVIHISHNRVPDPSGVHTFNGENFRDEQYLTFTRLDAASQPLWIRDARGNRVMQYILPLLADGSGEEIPAGAMACYDLAGRLLYQHSMDAGDRWTLSDAAGRPMDGWEENTRSDETGAETHEARRFLTQYDVLHRPVAQWLTINADEPQLIEQFFYGEQMSGGIDPQTLNLRGQLYQHFDQSGMIMFAAYDFKGNPREVQRRLASNYKSPVIGWQEGSASAGLESENFIQTLEYDALNRVSRRFNWHQGPESRVAVYEPIYNRRGLLESDQLVVRAVKKEKTNNAEGYEEVAESQRRTPIEEVTYNAKGQREKVRYGNGTITRYTYDTQTFRLRQLRTTRPGYDPPFPGNANPLKDDKVLQDLYYTYDAAGNIVEISDQAYETAFFRNQRVEPRSQYVYDALYRLISATGRENMMAGNDAPGQYESDPMAAALPVDPQALRNYTQYYTYDCAGNISAMRHAANGGGWTRRYEYDAHSNRLGRTWEGDPDWTGGNATHKTTYRHDQRGNLRNLANVAPAYFVQWDWRDMIQSLNLQGGGRVFYNYDSTKERSRKVNESQSGLKQWERIYLGGLEIYRKFNGTQTVEEIETLHLMDGGRSLLLVEDVLVSDSGLAAGPRYQYQYSNHLDSAVLSLDDSAAIISYEEYHPYGTTAYRAVNHQIKTTAKRYRYAGKERDEESGLYYCGARSYAAWLARWVSPDPALLIDGPNLYQYGRNCPTGHNDQKGTQAKKKTDPPKDKPKTDQVKVKISFYEDMSSVTVTEKLVSFKDKESHEFLSLSRQTFDKILKKTHGDVSKSLKELKSSTEFRDWLVKEYYKRFSGGNPKATNEVGGGKFRYATSKQLLAHGDTFMQCFYTSYFFMLKSLGVIPPDMSAREFEKAYSNVRGEPKVAPVFAKGEYGFPGAERSPDRATIVDMFAARAGAIASQSEWARFTGMSEKHFKAEDLRHPTLILKTVKGKTIETHPDIVDVAKVLQHLKAGETVHMGSSAWGHHVLATGPGSIDDPYPGTSEPRGSKEFWEAGKIFALWAE